MASKSNSINFFCNLIVFDLFPPFIEYFQFLVQLLPTPQGIKNQPINQIIILLLFKCFSSLAHSKQLPDSSRRLPSPQPSSLRIDGLFLIYYYSVSLILLWLISQFVPLFQLVIRHVAQTFYAPRLMADQSTNLIIARYQKCYVIQLPRTANQHIYFN